MEGRSVIIFSLGELEEAGGAVQKAGSWPLPA